jgi:hypothetical protein
MHRGLRYGLVCIASLFAAEASAQSSSRATFGSVSSLDPSAASDRPLLLDPVTPTQAVVEPPLNPVPLAPPAYPVFDASPVWGPPMWSAPPVEAAGLPYRLWVAAEVLLWQTQGQHVPALVTGAAAGTSRPSAGLLGAPTTRVLYGDGHLDDFWRPGLRLSAGYWLDSAQTHGLEVGGFFLGRISDIFDGSSVGNPGLFRPFFTPGGGANAELIAFQDPNVNPGLLTPVLAGAIRVRASNSVNSEELNYRRLVVSAYAGRVDFLLGYRRLGARDTLGIGEDLIATNPNPPINAAPAGTEFLIFDSFRTSNTFNGGQFGLAGQHWLDRWFMSWTTKVGLGDTHRTASVDGSSRVSTPFGTNTFTGGMLAQTSNIGRYSSDAFSVVPEVGVNIGRQMTTRLRLYAGYSFILWSNVWRAGEQVDLLLSQLPPTPTTATSHPVFLAHSTSMWMHGANFGAEYRY